MRRKILSFILALTLMAGMGSIAYAEEIDGSGNWHGRVGASKNPSIGVYGNYKAYVPTIKYCVNITWEDMTFDCIIEDNRIWNPNTHEYSGGYDLTIPSGVKYVTITNRSNTSVKVLATVTQAEGEDSVQGVKPVFWGAAPDSSEEFTLEDASMSMNLVHRLRIGLSKTEPGLNPEQFKGEGSVTKTVGTVTITVSDPNNEPSA